MSTDRIYIAKDGKSGKHVLVRILAIDDIGANYPPVDSNAFNELMMARDAKSLVLAAQGLGPMFAAKDDLAGRIFIPGELQQGIVREMNLVPSDLGSLLSECYFDPYAEPTGTDGVGYREIGRTGKKAARSPNAPSIARSTSSASVPAAKPRQSRKSMPKRSTLSASSL